MPIQLVIRLSTALYSQASLSLSVGLGLYVTKHGDACRDGDNPGTGAKGKVEWTNRAKQIVFRASHLFLFGGEAGGVEVRRAESGEVLQTLGLKDDAGDEASASRTARGRTRCLWGERVHDSETAELYALVENEADSRIVKIVEQQA